MTIQPTEPTTDGHELSDHDLLIEIHAFCLKLDRLLGRLEKALPMFLASMPPDMARELIG